MVDEVGFAPLDATGTQLLFHFVAAAYERRALGVASHWAINDWGRFLPEHTTTASPLDRLLHHAVIIVADGDSYCMRTRKEAPHHDPTQPGGGIHRPQVGNFNWPWTPRHQLH